MVDIKELLSNLEVQATIPSMQSIQYLFGILSIFFNSEMYYPKPADVYDCQSFDFIIVGGGTAGCVLANRLTESNWTVLLIEAGDLPPFYSDVPGMFPLLESSAFDWNDHTTNDGFSSQAHITNNIHMTQGKMLGGSSSLDYMLYLRGNMPVYDRWAKMGIDGWSWDEVLPYFIKSENLSNQAILKSDSGDLHGTHGPMGVTKVEWGTQTWKYWAAFQERGHKILLDINGYNQLGYAEPEVTANDGIRQSTAVSYIRPVKDRKNLFVSYNSFVTRIIIDGNKIATGVHVTLKNGKQIHLSARNEVILSTGAINSPKLLMLSGVGPRKHLEEFQIPVIYDNPRVGDNLHDMPSIPITLVGETNVLAKVNNLASLFYLGTFPSPYLMGLAALNPHQSYPDYYAGLMPVPPGSVIPAVLCSQILRLQNHVCDAAMQQERESAFGMIMLLNPKSRGRIELQGRDPFLPAVIINGFYSNLDDLDQHAYVMEDFASVLNTTYFKRVNGTIGNFAAKECGKYEFMSHEFWKCYVLNLASSLWNVAGTCSMGPIDEVVDNRLRVNGVKNLRVVDASVLPTSVNGHIKATVIMVAEKAADIIKEDHGFKPPHEHYIYEPKNFHENYDWLKLFNNHNY